MELIRAEAPGYMHNLCLYLYFKTRCSYTYLSILQAGIKIFILGSQFMEKLEMTLLDGIKM